MNEGIYAQYSKRINEIRNKDVLVIDVEKLSEYVDFSDMSREELERRCKRAAASVALYQNGYRSVARGSGYFLDYQNSSNPIYLQKLFENAKIDSAQKEQVLAALRKLLSQNAKDLPEYVQYVFQFDDNGLSNIASEISADQLLEMLKADAEAV